MGAPYKGGEQEESPRPSLLQRRGVRRDVREYSRLGEGGGEVGAAHEIMVELNSYEIATLPSAMLRAGLSVARNDNLAAGGYSKNSPSLYTTFPSARM